MRHDEALYKSTFTLLTLINVQVIGMLGRFKERRLCFGGLGLENSGLDHGLGLVASLATIVNSG